MKVRFAQCALTAGVFSCRLDTRLALSKLRPILLFAIVAASPAAFAQKTDLIFLANGDRITAEIKELSHGQMRLSTDAFGTIHVKWQEIERIESDKWLQVELVDGRRYLGIADKGGSSRQLELIVAGGSQVLDMQRIIYIQPFKPGERLDGNLDISLAVGFSYTSSSQVARWNVNASTRYRTEKYAASVTFDDIVTDNREGSDSKSRDLTFTYNRFLRDRWFWFGSSSYQENDELGIDGRFLFSAGGGRYVSQSASHEFLIAAGLSANLESVALTDPGGDDSEESTEALLVADWIYYKLYTPKSTVNLSMNVYPGLSDTDRVRGNLRLRYRQEFLKDLFWSVTYFDDFDSKPPAGALSKRDYGVVTSLEYKF